MKISCTQNRAVFLDRDGTLIIEKNYLSDPAQVELIPGVGEALAALQSNGFFLIGITNQSGIARGLITLAQYEAVQAQLSRELSRYDVTLSRTYFCPHLPDQGCACRKPLPGLLKTAIQDFKLLPSLCYMIGDRDSDVAAGYALDIPGILVQTGYGTTQQGTHAKHRSPSLLEAAGWILNHAPISL